MGITLDISRSISKHKKENTSPQPSSSKNIKYLLLTAFAVAAFFEVNQIFWGSPIALITRLYTLFLHPLVLLLGNLGLDTLRPLLTAQDIELFAYTQISPRFFHTVYFVAGFFLLLFYFEWVRPRFWCRYLCPAGAILALLSWRPLWRRRVHTCVHCGQCAQSCPTGAISPEGDSTLHSECITCRTCVHLCPVQGVTFSCSHTQKSQKKTAKPQPATLPPMPSRRAFLYAATAGGAIASLGYMNAASFIPSVAKASLAQLGTIRPPGAIPESDFLRRCIRCGQCMKACPTNGLQPSWGIQGIEGIFSPLLMSRIGPCEPECNACGAVCPTGAILDLPLADKRKAKIGTAVVYPELCLAWAEGRSCVVCQEVCAYGAVQVKPHGNSKVPVPIITQNKCFGCGFCERHCPVRIPAIVVQPLNALRLSENTFSQAAQNAGLDLVPVSLRPHVNTVPQSIPKGQLPPGFSN